MLKVLLFDWGDTLMRDFPQYQGPMATWPKVETMPGAKEALAVLSTKYLCCVATNAGNSGAEQVTQALERGEIASYFLKVFTPAELKVQKPTLRFYRKISEQLHVQPNECAMIGNSFKNDILPAKKVGMSAIWVHSQAGKSGFHQKEGYWVIRSLKELPLLLKKFDPI